MKKIISIFLCVTAAVCCAQQYVVKPKMTSQELKLGGRTFHINYDESKADSTYAKLDTLERIGGGGKIESALEWVNQERPKVIKFLEKEYFGHMPPRPEKMEFKLVEESDNALDGTALRRQYKIISSDKLGEFSFDVLVYIPKNAAGTVPAFINANYAGNHTVSAEPEILIPEGWMRNNPVCGITDNRADTSQRGLGIGRHPMKEIIARGYAVATFCYCTVYPDKDQKKEDGAPESIYRIFEKSAIDEYPRAIPAWAWANCRVLDLLERIPQIDAKHVCVVGHSRLGKTAILSGAYDTRFAMTISNSSCCGGAATNRRNFGETLESAVWQFPYWYQPALKKYGEDIESMPIDQQHFIACIAPRPVVVTSGTEDFWADPRGEMFSLIEASKIYALFGAKKLPTFDDFKAEKPFNGDVCYILYKGGHDINLYCWNSYMDYADYLGWNKNRK